jgi:DNA-binding CsgD family transcriptional regulator
MRPVGTSPGDDVSPPPVGQVVRPHLTMRGLAELLAELVGSDESKVILLAIVTNERAYEGRSRPRAARAAPRPVALATGGTRHPADSGWASLTDRERTVALLAGHALTNQQIANRLRISPHTVNFHLRQVFRKLAIDSRVRLARIVQAQPPVVNVKAREGQPTDSTRTDMGAEH